MRPIFLANVDKLRPVVILTREGVRGRLNKVTVAPVTSRAIGLATEVTVGPDNGLDHESVVNFDNVTTIPVSELRRHIGFVLPHQEAEVTRALVAAFDLELEAR